MLQGLKVKSQLMLLSGVLLAFLVAVGALGAYSVQAESQAIKALHDDRVVPLKQLKSVSDMYAVNIVDAAHKARDGVMTPAQARESIAQARSVVNKEWTAYLSTQLVPRETELVERIKPLMQSADVAVAQLDALLAAGDKEGLAAFTATQMYPLIDPLQGVVADLIQVQLDVALATYEDSVRTASALISTVFLSVVAALVLGGGLALWIARHLTRALGGEPEQVRQAALAVAEGDLTHRLDVRADDQHSVMAAMQTMIQKLQRIVGTVRENAQSVASASSQIAMGNQDLANRNETQASALEETAASMEELGSTVKQNADNARQANQLAQGASGVATEGGQVVAQVVDTMRQINESSKKIADIITVIDGIAFQTNILALNAAVEAARAGEQGRGFAVVAGEVRSLAQRSAGAAKEIKDLISASVERVEQGTQLVDRAGTTMDEIVNSIRRVTDIMGEISAANTEQSLGVAQVGQAVTLMDQATQQNASLVEESASAAAALNVQAERLLHIVSRFKLGGESAPAGTQASAGFAPKAAPVARPASGPSSRASAATPPRPAPAPAQRAPSPAAHAPADAPAPAATAPSPAAASPAASKPASKPAPKPAPVITPMAGRAKAVSVPASTADDDWESF